MDREERAKVTLVQELNSVKRLKETVRQDAANVRKAARDKRLAKEQEKHDRTTREKRKEKYRAEGLREAKRQKMDR